MIGILEIFFNFKKGCGDVLRILTMKFDITILLHSLDQIPNINNLIPKVKCSDYSATHRPFTFIENYYILDETPHFNITKENN